MLTAGIDVGSRTTKIVILNNGKVQATGLQPTGANSINRAKDVLQKTLKTEGLCFKDLDYVIATGYGRVNISFADDKITEITCHAIGASQRFPATRTIIDIGGQDSKVIRLTADNKVEDFIMNDKCAAGTGRFLEVMADTLEVSLQEIGNISLQTDEAAVISSTCTVFAESEVIGLIAQGVDIAKILRGLHTAIVRRLKGMIYRVGLQEEVTLTGGVCLNKGVRKLLAQELNTEINVPECPQLIGALGAAILAKMKLEGNYG